MPLFAIAWKLGALYLVLAGLIPTSVRTLGPRPHPADDYAAATVREQAVRLADTVAIACGRSIILLHGRRTPRAIVLFHGLGNSPVQDRQLADTLYERGDNVFVPRMPRHALPGANADDLARLTADELRDTGDTAIDIATGLGDTVVVLGLSLGGDVAAWTAQFRPEVYRAVIVAPALALAHIPRPLAMPLMNLVLRLPNFSHTEPPDSLRPDRALGWSTHGVGQMLRLGAAVREAAADRAPLARDIRIVVNANDHTVSRGAIRDLAAQWSARGAPVLAYEFPDSLHLPHDVIDPDEAGGNTAVTYPVLIALVYGRTPPARFVKPLVPRDSAAAHRSPC